MNNSDFEKRIARIKASLERINGLMKDLKDKGLSTEDKSYSTSNPKPRLTLVK